MSGYAEELLTKTTCRRKVRLLTSMFTKVLEAKHKGSELSVGQGDKMCKKATKTTLQRCLVLDNEVLKHGQQFH